MIWIATLCLLAVIAWLFFNALNEKRWVEAHSHDETVAADQGFLPDFSKVASRLGTGADGRVSIDQEDTRFARTVRAVRERGERVGERVEDIARRSRERGDGESLFGRAVARVGGTVDRLEGKLDARTREKAAGRAPRATEEGTLFGKATARVDGKLREYGERVRERTARKARTDEPARPAREEEGLFGKAVAAVSPRLERVERRLDEKASTAREGVQRPMQPDVPPERRDEVRGVDRIGEDDFLGRMSKKIGGKINELDERVVDASKNAARKIDKKTDL